MSPSDDQSPDEPLGTETYEQGDEALDEASRVDSDFLEDLEQDPSLDPTLQVDDRELEEVGAELDDPEKLVTLDGGMDDPDGLGGPGAGTGTGTGTGTGGDDGGWNLDAPLAGGRDDGD